MLKILYSNINYISRLSALGIAKRIITIKVVDILEIYANL